MNVICDYFGMLETVAIGFVALLLVVDPPGYWVALALILGALHLGSYLVARRGTWLGAAAVLARSRPDMGLAWLAEQPDLKRHIRRLMLIGSVQLLFFAAMLIQLFQNGWIQPQFVLVWLTGALILQASRMLADVLGYRSIRHHLAVSVS